jgi:hypothetical protein
MPYGVPDDLWKKLPPEDQNEVINEWYGHQVVPDIGGYAPTPTPTPSTPQPPRVPASTKPGEITWAYVRSLNSFPGNHPYFDADKAAGIGGYMLALHDPLLEFGAAACQAAGFQVGIWDDPHGQDPVTWAQELAAAARKIGASTVAPDPESTGKGYAGSPGWNWNQAAADALRAAYPGITIIVTPTPNQDDFNYAAWTGNDSLVWVQLYGEKLSDLFNADEVINRVAANGVPRNRIGALIPAGAVAQYVAELQKLGVSHWAIYTIDDVTPDDRTVPFGDPDSPAPPPPPAEPPSDATGDTEDDVSLDDYDDSVYTVSDDTGEEDVDDPPDSLGDTSASLYYLTLDPNQRQFEALPKLAPSPLRAVKPPGQVTDDIKRDLLLRKVPSNIAAGIRMALLIVEKGVPYVWGGTDPNHGLDCSAFARLVISVAGYKAIRRVTYDQYKQGRHVSPGHRQPLDLCFFYPTRQGPDHVAIYMADGWAVHEPHTGEVAQWVRVDAMPLVGTRRYFKDVKGTYAAEQNVPQTTPPPKVADIDDLSTQFHSLMNALGPNRASIAGNVRSTADRLIGGIK